MSLYPLPCSPSRRATGWSRTGRRGAAAWLLAGCLAVLAPAAAAGQDAVEPLARGGPSAETARWLAVGGTLVPIAIALGSAAAGNGPGAAAGALLLIPGPSLGYYYGGRPLRGLASTGVRVGALLGIPAGIGVCWDRCSGGRALLAGFLFRAGAGLFIASIVYDVTHVADDVRRHAGRGGRARIAPILDPVERRVGLALRVRL